MITLTDEVTTDIRAHAERDYPRESCGLVIVERGRMRYKPIKNVAEGTEHFVMDDDEQTQVEDLGAVLAVVHSHPNENTRPSQGDMVECERHGLPWIIVNWPTGVIYQFEPSGYVAPLYGRVFHHGILDCYTFVRDYYKRTLNIQLNDMKRRDDWWLKGENLYLDNFQANGFVLVDGPMQEHDGILIMSRSKVPNHGAVYIGSGLIGHHQFGRLSSKDVYGGWFRKHTTHILRHKELMK